MINFNFNNVSREQLTLIALNAIKALSDTSCSDSFKLTISVDCELDYSFDSASGGSHVTPSGCSL